MASEIRVNKINSRTGVGTITLSPTGVDFTGIATVATLKATTGIVTTFSTTGNATVGGTLGVTGETTFATHVNLGDNDKAKFGDSADLQIYHDGSHSYVLDNGTGDLRLASNSITRITKGDSETCAAFNVDGASELYHDNSKKFETTSTGVTVTGNISLDDSTSASNGRLNIGTGDDLQIYHYDNANYIDNESSIPLYIRVNGSETAIVATANDSVDLYYDNSKKFETSSTGVTVTGNVAVTSGNGIDFSATSDGSGSSQAELLDDYETGNWTPVIKSGASDVVSYTGGEQYFRYIKVGRLVTLCVSMNNVTTSGNTGGNVLISGLPFASHAGNSNNRFISGDVMFYNTGFTMSGWPVWAHQASGDTTINFYEKASAGAGYGSVNVNSVGSGSYFFFSLQYYTA